ncbi:hypothetical protein PTSG_04763 [Salpingoeca rosetta]|uniref:Uncharacterized protein n=1 Tax=Salpingoeca rosetta (strain ATCC 50818 / BSB-021) TaxID=946362 RepID=F2U9M3_SALR5|nr:uncharacterized protein PTSG_04763 [Salpingoeca rosetta]EGD73050.1 hypothetical protein PTSG_04763 [Salpingoeca rosetta]|eukprot:XP_004994081.1 hypothetical protein PTSG_04763 [Salpingoeca rosetta]
MAERTTTTRNAGGGGGEEDALAYLQRHCVQERLSAALLAAASETISFGTPPMTAVANALNSNKPQDLFTYRTLATNAKSRVRFLQLFNAMCRDLHPTNPALTGTEYLQLLRLICPDFPSSVIEDVLNILLVECTCV